MLTNEDEDNFNEKEIDNLDTLVNEKTISLAFATTQLLSRRDSNFATEGKKSLVLGQDCNHIISIRQQIKDWKRIQVELNFALFTAEGPANSVLRGISANRGCSKIIHANSKTKVVCCLQARQRRFLLGDPEVEC